ncbi:MAG: DNA polymerase IV [Candidatus Micrarchaeaceae archaeon]
MRIVLLIDMDYFFAACEELRRPEIKGRPVVVGADPKNGTGRGVVSTCNYIARKYGIRSGMPISTAYRLKPDAVFLPVDDAYYESVSEKVMAIIRQYADKFEQASIDEAFADVSLKAKGYDRAVEIASEIKKSINDSLGLPCSIGIGPNKLIAKMACEAAKPNGIKLVKEAEAKEFIANMPVSKLYGIGSKTAAKLESEGFKKVSDLARANVMKLIDEFGTYGAELYKAANGIDESGLQENYEAKSIGREHTFEENTYSTEALESKIADLSKEVAQEVKRQGFAFTTITLKLRYANFDEHLKSKSINYASDEAKDIELAAKSLLEKFYDGSEPIRKIGVRVSGFVPFKGQKRLSSYK